MVDYVNIFGDLSKDDIGVFKIDNVGSIISPTILTNPKYRLCYMLQMFFANGGGACFIVSVGHYNNDNYSVKMMKSKQVSNY